MIVAGDSLDGVALALGSISVHGERRTQDGITHRNGNGVRRIKRGSAVLNENESFEIQYATGQTRL